MRPVAVIFACIAAHLQLVRSDFHEDAPLLGSKESPRLLNNDIVSGEYNYSVTQNHTVFFYHEDSEDMYVGGTGFVLKLDVESHQLREKFPVETTSAGQQHCQEGPCENVITVIEMFEKNLFVCGTNGQTPQCWKILPSVNNQSHDIETRREGMGISPYVYNHNCLSLTVEEDIYAAVPLTLDGGLLQFRRTAGSRTLVWMYDSWVSEPTFISLSWVKRTEDPDNEKIYMFFREKNSDHSPEADPWISRVARVCKVDEGGPKRLLQNIWTSFLKARLVCGFPEESLYFNHLLDIYVMHADDWHDTRVYGLFTSSWNASAVCIYSIGMIENTFEKSTFKDHNKDVPLPRPGTCVKNSKDLPFATLTTVRDYPEMTDWVHSIHHAAPFYTSNNNYTKLIVDKVRAADNRLYNILLLATDSGKIHKVLEAGSESFVISETQLSSSSPMQSMTLDSKKKMLVVGFSEKISFVDLQRCQKYNNSCSECVLARDPYCAWTKSGCCPTVPGAIQDVMNGAISVCLTSEASIIIDQNPICRMKRGTAPESPVNLNNTHVVPLGISFYLSCPIDSYHAVYTWEHNDNSSSPCLQMQLNCLHLIPAMTRENYGTYRCVSKEKDFTKVVKTYQLKQTSETAREIKVRNHASTVVTQIGWITYGLTAAMVFRLCVYGKVFNL